MYDILKTIATTNSYPFCYARKDYANLFDEVELPNIAHIFLDPIVIDSTFDDQNSEESKTYSGSFMILASSDIDEQDYDTRYQTYMKPLLNGASEIIKTAIQCEGSVNITLWRETEIINIFDYNLDGIVVTYVITE